MKKILALLFALHALTTFGQETQKSTPFKSRKDSTKSTTGYIAAYYGAGFPLGIFKKTSLVPSDAGFAKDGSGVLLDCALPIHRSNLGFALNASYNANNLNSQAYGTAYNHSYNAIDNFSIKNGIYKAVSVMGGVYFTHSFRRFSIDLKMIAGLAFCTRPDFTTTIYDLSSNKTYISNYNAVTSRSLAYGGSLTVRYAVTKHFCMLIQGSIVSTEAHYTPIVEQITWNELWGPYPAVTIFDLSFGLGYQFIPHKKGIAYHTFFW